jgi:hypothetical protein|nr:MAG TPA: hypothetical protein [Caudoviricetes sp.]
MIVSGQISISEYLQDRDNITFGGCGQCVCRNATGVPRHMRMPVGGIDWAVCQSWEPVPTIKFEVK